MFGYRDFFTAPPLLVARWLDDLPHVWDAVGSLPGFIERTIQPGIHGEVEDGAWLEPGAVELREGARVERGAIVRGPTIIGAGSVVRSLAHLRGHVLLGEGCRIGTGAELRQVMMLDGSSIAHQNCVFTSILGHRVWIAGHASTANTLLSRKPIAVRIDVGGKRLQFPTGLSAFGAVIGDDTSIGGMTVLNPATIIGRECLVHPCSTVHGYVPHGSEVRPTQARFEVVPRRR